jgi:electron transfer flavoprotein alpha subunit
MLQCFQPPCLWSRTGNLLQIRPAIGGNSMATIKTPDHRPQMAMVRPWDDRRVEVLGIRKADDGRTSLEGSEVVVLGGRGQP